MFFIPYYPSSGGLLPVTQDSFYMAIGTVRKLRNRKYFSAFEHLILTLRFQDQFGSITLLFEDCLLHYLDKIILGEKWEQSHGKTEKQRVKAVKKTAKGKK